MAKSELQHLIGAPEHYYRKRQRHHRRVNSSVAMGKRRFRKSTGVDDPRKIEW